MKNKKSFFLNSVLSLLIVLILASQANAYDFTVFPKQQNMNICPCSSVDNDITIRNDGSEYASFHISQQDSTGKFSLLTAKSIMLIPGESKTVRTQASMPCTFKGESKLTTTITAFGDSRDITQSISASNALSCSDFSMEISAPKSPLCNGAGYWFYIKAENKAKYQNLINFKVNDLNWAFFVNQSILLNPGAKGYAFGRITVPVDMFGNKKMVITASPANSQLSKELSYEFDVAPCYYPAIKFEDSSFSSCYKEQVEVNFDVMNEGIKNDSYELQLLEPSNGALSEHKINLLNGKKSSVKVTLFPEDRDYNIPIKVSLQSLTNPNINLEKTATFHVSSVETCKKPSLVYDNIINKNISFNSYGLKLTNRGLENSEYLIYSEGPNWVDVVPHFAQLAPGEAMDLTLTTSPEGNQTQGKFFENITITVKDTDLTYNYLVPITLKTNEPFKMNWMIVWTAIIIILLAVLVWIIILFIKKTPKGLKSVEPELFLSEIKRDKNPFKYILFILLLLLLIGLIAVVFIQLKPAVTPEQACADLQSMCSGYEDNLTYYADEEPVYVEDLTGIENETATQEQMPSTKDMDPFLFHKWPMNTRYYLNLSNYITDMDNSGLKFIGIPSDHIDVVVENGVATFIPQGNWSGIENVSFVVRNNRGFEKETPPIMLYVEDESKREEKSVLILFKENIEVNKTQLAIFFIFVLFIIIVFIVLSKTRKKKIVVRRLKR